MIFYHQAKLQHNIQVKQFNMQNNSLVFYTDSYHSLFVNILRHVQTRGMISSLNTVSEERKKSLIKTIWQSDTGYGIGFAHGCSSVEGMKPEDENIPVPLVLATYCLKVT